MKLPGLYNTTCCDLLRIYTGSYIAFEYSDSLSSFRLGPQWSTRVMPLSGNLEWSRWCLEHRPVIACSAPSCRSAPSVTPKYVQLEAAHLD